jgi:hypothetical protein
MITTKNLSKIIHIFIKNSLKYIIINDAERNAFNFSVKWRK